jgi:hypothetical protein
MRHRGPVLAGLAVRLVLAAVRAVLAQLDPVGVVTPVLARDVVAVLALLAGQGDLGPHVGGSHEGVPFSRTDPRAGPAGRASTRRPSVMPETGPVFRPPSPEPVMGADGTAGVLVAEAGLEPATQRL